MALRKDFKYECKPIAHLPWGMQEMELQTHTLPDAYIKVMTVEGSKNEQVATVLIASGNKESVHRYAFVPNLNGPNFIAQAYEHMKTLPEFEGAVDC